MVAALLFRLYKLLQCISYTVYNTGDWSSGVHDLRLCFVPRASFSNLQVMLYLIDSIHSCAIEHAGIFVMIILTSFGTSIRWDSVG